MNPGSLDTLRDIHLPPPPWLGPAVCLLAVMAILAGAWYVVRFRRRRRLRAALRELSSISATYLCDRDATRLACDLSRLVRGYAMTCFPQARIAGLTGPDWLRFLDAHGGGGAFCNGAGAVLETRPYQDCGDLDAAALLALVRLWLKANPR